MFKILGFVILSRSDADRTREAYENTIHDLDRQLIAARTMNRKLLDILKQHNINPIT